MSTKTKNYELVKPELTDTADITATNGNWDIVDEELKKKYGSDNKPTASDLGVSPAGHKHTTSEITDFPTSMTPTEHNHSASDINSGTFSSDRLPTVPVAKGGTGATSASSARTNLGIKSETWTVTLEKEDGSTETVTKLVCII